MNLRIGQGIDVHRWIAGRPLMLGGVHIPHDYGLLGHSDADVLLHAIMDALLGAAGLGDIGRHFPDSDATYAGIDSKLLLGRIATELARHHWRIVNIDATVICQRPRLSPHFAAMQGVIGTILSLPVSSINLKATTTEGLGFTGRDEGVAATAVTMIEGTAIARE
ncbi:MAG: 2-C-methyl-D-erythritol 2,4-cyclodiphosphate synthase [Magnetococcales bacterium]|nr:2-C-methyl-D-erythritol 2,4-cyclodiphosphate synthase [Magnetococcales bacterium]MBF0157587.1 2-C-methyl-D-erythritol 2,4-cyclodiphosphate synthase [Magnetococcales bacterium]